MLPQAAPLNEEAQFKLALMQALDRGITERYSTTQGAANMAEVNWEQIWRLRKMVHKEVSVRWLFRVASRLGIRIRINVELAS